MFQILNILNITKTEQQYIKKNQKMNDITTRLL